MIDELYRNVLARYHHIAYYYYVRQQHGNVILRMIPADAQDNHPTLSVTLSEVSRSRKQTSLMNGMHSPDQAESKADQNATPRRGFTCMCSESTLEMLAPGLQPPLLCFDDGGTHIPLSSRSYAQKQHSQGRKTDTGQRKTRPGRKSYTKGKLLKAIQYVRTGTHNNPMRVLIPLGRPSYPSIPGTASVRLDSS